MDGLLPTLPVAQKGSGGSKHEEDDDWMDEAESEEIFNKLNELRLTLEFKLRSSGAFESIEDEFFQLTSLLRQLESNFQQQREDHEFLMRSVKKAQISSSPSPSSPSPSQIGRAHV